MGLKNMVARTKPDRTKLARQEQFSTNTTDYIIYCCADGHVHVDIMRKDEEPLQLTFDGEGAYDFAQALLRGYDVVNGIDGPDH